jgi:hypothetical protein
VEPYSIVRWIKNSQRSRGQFNLCTFLRIAAIMFSQNAHKLNYPELSVQAVEKLEHFLYRKIFRAENALKCFSPRKTIPEFT